MRMIDAIRNLSHFSSITSKVVPMVAAVTFSSVATTQPASPPSPCATPEHRQFDFWVGEWNVFRADTGKEVAQSRIERLYDGCAIRESWLPFKGTPGGSLNVYRPSARDWRQVWTDQGNELHDYHGGWTGHAMALEGTAVAPTGEVRRVRMTFEPAKDGSVVQTGYAWSDKRSGWELDYQFVYRPAQKG